MNIMSTADQTKPLSAPAGVVVRGPIEGRFAEILTPEALAFVAALHRRFEARRVELLQARKARQGRMPVGIQTVYIEDGQTRTDRAVYQLGYSLHPRMLRGDKLELEGLSLARRGVAGDLQAAADNLWAAR